MSRREVHEMVELPLANKLRRLKTHFAFTIWPLHSIKEILFRFALTPFLKSVVFDHKLSLPLETVRLFIEVSQTPAKAEKSEKRIKRAPKQRKHEFLSKFLKKRCKSNSCSDSKIISLAWTVAKPICACFSKPVVHRLPQRTKPRARALSEQGPLRVRFKSWSSRAIAFLSKPTVKQLLWDL